MGMWTWTPSLDLPWICSRDRRIFRKNEAKRVRPCRPLIQLDGAFTRGHAFPRLSRLGTTYFFCDCVGCLSGGAYQAIPWYFHESDMVLAIMSLVASSIV